MKQKDIQELHDRIYGIVVDFADVPKQPGYVGEAVSKLQEACNLLRRRNQACAEDAPVVSEEERRALLE
jgi:hypothetical protein